MAQFVFVGGNPGNLHGASAKGWTIHRRRTTVVRRWGAIEVEHIQYARYYWKGVRQQEARDRCGSIKAAIAFARKRINEQEEQGYIRLSSPARIRQKRIQI